MCERKQNWYGMNWCRPTTRLAIYLRDGMGCLWCGKGVEDGIALSLDHKVPVKKGGTNDPSNMFTSCCSCNYKRQDKPVATFARVLARERHIEVFVGTVARTTVNRIRNAVRRSLPREEAREMIRRRGSVKKVLETTSSEEEIA